MFNFSTKKLQFWKKTPSVQSDIMETSLMLWGSPLRKFRFQVTTLYVGGLQSEMRDRKIAIVMRNWFYNNLEWTRQTTDLLLFQVLGGSEDVPWGKYQHKNQTWMACRLYTCAHKNCSFFSVSNKCSPVKIHTYSSLGLGGSLAHTHTHRSMWHTDFCIKWRRLVGVHVVCKSLTHHNLCAPSAL